MNKCLKPSHEYHSVRTIGVTPTLNMLCEDSHFTSRYKTPNKKKVAKVTGTTTCELCGAKKYFQYNCPFCVIVILTTKVLFANLR